MSRRVFLFVLMVLFLGGCQGLATKAVGPAGSLGGGSPAATPAAPKEEFSTDEAPEPPASAAPLVPSGSSNAGDVGLPPPVSGGFAGGLPPSTNDLIAVAGDNPQAGGVSALPGAVEDGEGSRIAFDFTLTGSAQPICVEQEPEISVLSAFPRIHYLVRGTVGAALLDGTDVPLNGCEVVMLRFQTGSRCQDIRAKADCSLFGSVKLRPGDKPKIYFLTNASMSDDCDDLDSAHIPSKNELTFLPSPGKLSECKDPASIDSIIDSILSQPKIMTKIPKP